MRRLDQCPVPAKGKLDRPRVPVRTALVSRALLPAGEAQTKRQENGPRGGSIVAISPGSQMFYREDWLGAPWLDMAAHHEALAS